MPITCIWVFALFHSPQPWQNEPTTWRLSSDGTLFIPSSRTTEEPDRSQWAASLPTRQSPLWAVCRRPLQCSPGARDWREHPHPPVSCRPGRPCQLGGAGWARYMVLLGDGGPRHLFEGGGSAGGCTPPSLGCCSRTSSDRAGHLQILWFILWVSRAETQRGGYSVDVGEASGGRSRSTQGGGCPLTKLLRWRGPHRSVSCQSPLQSPLRSWSPCNPLQSPLQWRPKKLQRPQLWPMELQRPLWRPTRRRHPALRNGGGGGRRVLPPFKAWRPFQSPLLARRPSLSRSSSSPCRRRPCASPCRRRPCASPCGAAHAPRPAGRPQAPLPAPPKRLALPEPPKRLALPEPPKRLALPAPPRFLVLPAPLKCLALPVPPRLPVLPGPPWQPAMLLAPPWPPDRLEPAWSVPPAPPWPSSRDLVRPEPPWFVPPVPPWLSSRVPVWPDPPWFVPPWPSSRVPVRPDPPWSVPPAPSWLPARIPGLPEPPWLNPPVPPWSCWASLLALAWLPSLPPLPPLPSLSLCFDCSCLVYCCVSVFV